jgi:arginyl-tRNA synthetase
MAGEQFKISHLDYDFVTLKEGMMASRSGNVITYRQLLAEALEKARVEIAKRHEDWTEEKLQTIAFALAKAALKFEMLKVSSDKIIVFDVSEALRFEGYTAAYLQYTGARLASILRKAKMNSFAIANFSLLTQDKEKQLLLMLQKFTEVVKVASVKRDPSLVARYLFELTQLFNDYYHAFPVLKTEANLQAARLQLLIATQQVIKNAFNLLGLDYLEEM